jgi:peptidoglycan glycosyltransferase
VVTDINAATSAPYPYVLPGTTTPLVNDTGSCDTADLDLDTAMALSCNSVLGYLGVQTGLDPMVAMAQSFGFNDPRLDIPVRAARSNFDTTMNQSQVALSSIGQFDTAATPLVMAMVAAGVADNGTVMYPQLVDKLTKADGTTVQLMRPRSYKQAMSPAVAGQVQQLMTDVVTGGTGGRAAIPGATVGGKTGTAQHGVDNKGLPFAWFVSYAKVGNDYPVAVAVVVEDGAAQSDEISGGSLAAPIAKQIMQAAIGKQ